MNGSAMRLRRGVLVRSRVLVVAMVAGLSVWGLSAWAAPSAAHAAPRAAEVPVNPFCYSWTFRNYTAIDADGLTANFTDASGSGSVSEVYTDTGHPFSSVVLTRSQEPSGAAATRINYSGGVVPASDEARVGFCRHTGDTAAQFSWKGGSGDAQPAPRTLGVIWQWSKLGQLTVALTNQQAITLGVTSLWLYDAADGLTPAEMTLDATTGLQPVANLGEDVLTLAPGTSQTMTVQFGTHNDIVPQSGHPFVLVTIFAPEDDLGDESVIMLQAFSPQAVYLPLLMKE